MSTEARWGTLSACPDDFVVTGASGWLGRAAVHVLRDELGTEAVGSRLHAFASSTRTVDAGPASVDARALGSVEDVALDRPFHLLHFAALTRDAVTRVGRGAFLATNRGITDAVRSLIDRPACRSVVFASSGAVYGTDARVAPDPRGNPYGWVKARDERELGAACAARSIPMITARVFNVSGPYMTKPSAFALGDLTDRALSGRPLEIQAQHPVVRSYVCVLDLARVMLAASASVDASLLVDVAGAEPVEIGELAQRLRRVAGRPDLPIRRGPLDGTEDRYLGDPDAFVALAGELGVDLAPLDEQLHRTLSGRAAALRHPAESINV